MATTAPYAPLPMSKQQIAIFDSVKPRGGQGTGSLMTESSGCQRWLRLAA